MIDNRQAHIRYDTTNRPVVDMSDNIPVEGAGRPGYVPKDAITTFYL
jgi:hypothetical protein